MKGDHLPDQDHAARYCPGSKLTEDGRIAPTAFHLRIGEPYLSAEWLEHVRGPTRTDEIQSILHVLSQKLHLGSSARIAVLNVGEVCGHVFASSGFRIRFLHEPEPDDPAHCGIFDTRQDEMLIAELMAEKVTETYSAQPFQGI